MESSPVAPDPIVTVPVADLLRVSPFKGSGDMRYYLNGVLVMPYEGHALLMATNGHWMAIYESEEARADKERILDLPAWFLTQVSEAERDSPFDEDDDRTEGETPSTSGIPKRLVVKDEKSHLIITEKSTEILAKPGLPFIDGKFPDCLKVMPDPATLERGVFYPVNVNYLASLHEVVSPGRASGISCYHQRGAPDKPVVFRFDQIPELVVALMPMKEGHPYDWPKWTQKPAKEDAA